MEKYHSGIEVKCLDESYINSFIALRDSLPEDKQEFVKPRTAEDLKAHLDTPMPIMGVFKDGHLVAGALLTYPQYAEQTKYLDQYPLTPATAVLQAVVSTQKGMMPHLVHAAKSIAKENGYTSLIAKVRTDNACMLRSIDRQGFDQGAVYKDPLGSLCGVHFAKATTGEATGTVPLISSPPVSDLPVCQSPTAEPLLVY